MRNQPGSNQNSNSDNTALNAIYEELEFYQMKVETLTEAANILEGDSSGNGGSSISGNRNMNNQNSSSGGRGSNFKNRFNNNQNRSSNSNSNTNFSSIDDLTPNDVSMSEDGSVDLRTKAGRILQGEGLVDDQGFPTPQGEKWFGFSNAGSSSGNRSFNQNNFSTSHRSHTGR